MGSAQCLSAARARLPQPRTPHRPACQQGKEGQGSPPALLTSPGFAFGASLAAVQTSPLVPAAGTRNLGTGGGNNVGLFSPALTPCSLGGSSPKGRAGELPQPNPTRSQPPAERRHLLHSPGVWHRAEGTPRKGGLKWGPRAIWGAFWGESSGGGWDISLRGPEKEIQVEKLAQEEHPFSAPPGAGPR